MRVTCAHCHQRFDIAHTAVLAEAERLKAKAAVGQVPVNAPGGNVLDPHDEQATKQRQAIIARRQTAKPPH